MMKSDVFFIPELADEEEYPVALRESYEILECMSQKEDSETLLVRRKADNSLHVCKCFLPSSPLFMKKEPEFLRTLGIAPFPRFTEEIQDGIMRCVLRTYIPGMTLKEVRYFRNFTEEEVIRIGLQLCDQLKILHDQVPAVIHRDIKPENVIMKPDGNVVLIDFDISRVLTDQSHDTIAFGTQGYAPPEQYGFSQTDARSDIYSLGALMSWMTHDRVSIPEKPYSALDRVLIRCMAFDPAGRYASIDKVRYALHNSKPDAVRKRHILTDMAALLLLGVLLFLFSMHIHHIVSMVHLSEPLIEKAVRLSLGLDEGESLTKAHMEYVEGIYIVADAAYPDAGDFYTAIEDWYASGKKLHGTIRTLDDLKIMTNLSQVCIVGQEIENLTPITSLKMLDKIEAKHNNIKDIMPLAGMNHLTSVGINDNPVNDLSPLLECPSLAFLDLCDVCDYDPTVIGKLGDFDYLDLSNPTDSYLYLAGKNIQSLDISWTGVTSLECLNEVEGLEKLRISHTTVSDLSPLKMHTSLTELDIAYTNVNDLSPLLELPNLEMITVTRNMLPMLRNLGEVPFSFHIEP